MRLIEDCGAVLKRAWSVRLALLTGVLSALELLVAVFAGPLTEKLPPGTFATLAILTSVAAAVARIIPQRNLEP